MKNVTKKVKEDISNPSLPNISFDSTQVIWNRRSLVWDLVWEAVGVRVFINMPHA